MKEEETKKMLEKIIEKFIIILLFSIGFIYNLLSIDLRYLILVFFFLF